MIEINGLEPHEVRMLDAMWACDTFEEYEAFLATLTDHGRRECARLERLVLLAELDELVAEMPLDQVRKLLDKYRL